MHLRKQSLDTFIQEIDASKGGIYNILYQQLLAMGGLKGI